MNNIILNTLRFYLAIPKEKLDPELLDKLVQNCNFLSSERIVFKVNGTPKNTELENILAFGFAADNNKLSTLEAKFKNINELPEEYKKKWKTIILQKNFKI